MFSKEQRNGIFLLILLIIALQCIYFFVDFSPANVVAKTQELEKFNKELDSLRLVQLEKEKPKIYPFNPNYLTDFKGASLGLSNEEIDRLLAFRKQNKWINSPKQFQDVTKVSDTLLSKISPYFKFPEWVNKPKTKYTSNGYRGKTQNIPKEKRDLNKITAKELQEVHGIGKVLSQRIVRFRNRFKGGFISDVQLQDVYGLTPELISKVTNRFTVKTPRKVQGININQATVENLVTIQHIDYDLAHKIIEHRNLINEYHSFDELMKVKDFPVNKIDIIKLYLSLD